MATYQLPPMEHTFSIEVRGKETKKMFSGEFTYRRPNLRQQAEIQKLAVRMNGDLRTLPRETLIYHDILATLMTCLIQTPEWWAEAGNGAELYDINVAQEVYRECMKFEQDWTNKVWGKDPDGVETDGAKEGKKAKGKKTDVPDES